MPQEDGRIDFMQFARRPPLPFWPALSARVLIVSAVLLAVTSLFYGGGQGLLGLILGPANLLVAIIGLSRRATYSQRGKVYLVGCLIAGSLFMFDALAVEHGCRSREQANRVKCSNNLRMIGLGMKMYAAEHDGRFPDSLDQLLELDMVSHVFVCPSSTDTPANGPTTQAIRADFARRGHRSYIYLGMGWTEKTAGESTILAYEPLENHQGDGANVLFGDIHVQWYSADGLRQLLKPARPPATTHSAP